MKRSTKFVLRFTYPVGTDREARRRRLGAAIIAVVHAVITKIALDR